MNAERLVDSPRTVPARASGFARDFLLGDGRATRFLARHPSRESDFDSRVAELSNRSPAGELWTKARESGARLGATGHSLENLDRLVRGEAFCVTTGQQPGLFLGPLYAIYKAMTAVRLAEWISRRSGRAVVPVFWIAADDSDFAEVASSYLPFENLRLERSTLAGGTLPAGGMVGDLSTAETILALSRVAPLWRTRPRGDDLVRGLERACERARDHGEIAAALLYDWLGATGLVVVDGRWPELRRAARGLFEQWANERGSIEDACLSAGRDLERAGYRTPISEPSIRTGLFDIESGRRLPFAGTAADLQRRIREAPETLSPNVVLRPLVQDSVLPNVATVAGPSEIAYHAQLSPVYERLGVTTPVLMPRFEATLVPRGVVETAARRGAPLEDFVADFDAAMKATSNRVIPDELSAALNDLDRASAREATRLREVARSFDPKLAESLAETERRLAETVARARERVADAAREAERRRDPSLRNYRDYLSPFRLPQERVLSAVTLPWEGGRGIFARFDSWIDRHREAVRDRSPVHWLIDLESLSSDGTETPIS